MKSLIIGAGIVGILVGGVALSGVVNADQPQQRQNGFGYERALETKAQVLSMEKDQLQTRLKDKTMAEIAAEQGFSLDAFRSEMKQVREQRWDSVGLSEEEQQERIQSMEQRHENCDGSGQAEAGEQHRYGRNH